MKTASAIDDTLDGNQTRTPQIDLAAQIHSEIQRLHETHQDVESLTSQLSEHRPFKIKELRLKLDQIQVKYVETMDQREHLKSSMEDHKIERLARKRIKAAKKNNISDLRKIMQNKLNEKIVRQKILLAKLNITFRCKFNESHWTLEFNYSGNKIMFQYDFKLDRFALTSMVPKISTFDEMQDLLASTNDIYGILSAWRYFWARIKPKIECDDAV